MKKSETNGFLVVSLDFELFWGMFDKTTIAEYGPNVLGERTAIPRMLKLFKEYEIHATWATVGMLMARTKDELQTFLPPPHLRPRYEVEKISAYHYIEHAEIGDTESTDPYHFGPSLLAQIIATPFQEIGNHTFSHYYCIDGIQNEPRIFNRDLEAYRAIAATHGVESSTIVFPRNQPSESALEMCVQNGIRAYRGNEKHVLYAPRKDSEQTLFIRGLRLLDHYINISGHHTYPLPTSHKNEIMNIPASRFMRPWSSTLRCIEWLRIRRIKKGMTYAAQHGEVFHLWWHPHNVGINQEQNFKNLTSILGHFKLLQSKYGMRSASMEDIVAAAHT